jgi:hypothetical protein
VDPVNSSERGQHKDRLVRSLRWRLRGDGVWGAPDSRPPLYTASYIFEMQGLGGTMSFPSENQNETRLPSTFPDNAILVPTV